MEWQKSGESIDGLMRNRVRVFQSLKGYRVSEDAILLAWFVRLKPGEIILDAGTGCGAIAFGLAVRTPGTAVIGLEIQAGLADRAARGVHLNDLETQVLIVRGDLRRADLFLRNSSFDAVVCNPPYHNPDRGRVSLLQEKALARHQLMMPLHDLFRVSARVLNKNGRLSLIYPVAGIEGLQRAMKETGFRPARMLWIHSHEGAAPGLLCLEARLGGCPNETTEEHLCLYGSPGERTPEAAAILAGEDIPPR